MRDDMRLLSQSLIVKTMGLVILTIASNTVLAKPSVKEKYEVLKQAKNYAQSVACATTFDDDNQGHKTTINDIHLIESQMDFSEENEIGTQYVVYWGGDWGCSGGSGTYSSFLTSFNRFSETRPFLVEKMDVLEDVNEDTYQINTRFIEDVKFLNGVFLITSSDYSDNNTDGGNNFPRYQYLYTVIYNDSSDTWKLANKKLLKDNYPNSKR